MKGSLTIPRHAEDLTKCMYELQQDGTFCDAGLECKDGVIFVHKLVLMACRSPYLRNQLASESQGTRVYVSLKNYSLKTVCCLVQILYTGQLNVSQENELNFRLLCETIGLDNIKSSAENVSQQDQNIYDVKSINQFCAVQAEEEILESQDGITALVASVNHGQDDNLVDSTNTDDSLEDLNYGSSDVKVDGDTVKGSKDSEVEREANKSLAPPTIRETRSKRRRKIYHTGNTSIVKDNATSANVAEILTIAKQLSGKDEAQPSKPASSCLDQTKSSVCYLCTKEFVNEHDEGGNIKDPSKTVCIECIVLCSEVTNHDQEMGTKPDQTQSNNYEDGGEDSEKGSVDLEEECLITTCEEGSPLPDHISLEEADCDPLPWLQEQIVNEINDEISDETYQEKLWHCKKCEFSTGDSKEQERHRKRHSYLEQKLRMSKQGKHKKYPCDDCGNEYKTECGLIQHKKIAHSDKPILRCVLRGCKSRFVEESTLQKHLLWHKSQGVLKCRKCAQIFVLKGSLKIHEDYCVKRLMFRCDICNKMYKAKETLSKHMKKVHFQEVKGFNYRESEVDQNKEANLPVEKTNLETTMEEFNTDNVEEFVERVNAILLTQENENKIRQTQDIYKCKKCEFSTEDKTQYIKHRRHHSYLFSKQKTAELQSHIFGDGDVTYDDIDNDNDDEDDEYVDDEEEGEDGEIDGIDKTLNKAINKKKKSKVYKCEKCNFSTKDDKDYEKHTRLHRNLERKETHVICRYCGLRYSNMQGLKRHELTTHSEKSYKCKVKSCIGVFKYKHQLEKHILNHRTRGLWACKKCNRKFLFKNQLTNHEDKCIRNMTANNMNKQSQCHLCGKQFGRKSELAVHMRKHNDGLLDCYCGKTFDNIITLNQHKKCHSDPMLKSYYEKEVSEESADSSDSDEMEDSTY